MTSFLDFDDSYDLRMEMIETQLLRRGINQTNILQAFETVPRHIFIPQVSLDEAYGDYPVPIKAGQTISQPYIVAVMLNYLELQASDTVLEIGSGSGYATGLLAKLAGQVDAMEVYRDLVNDSRIALNQLELTNITLTHQSAWEQFEKEKVYDRIVLWASPPRIPEHLFDMLGEGGILVAPEGKAEQYVWIYKRKNGQLKRERKDAVRFVPLVQGSTSEIDGI